MTATAPSRRPPAVGLSHGVVHRDTTAYCAHPHLAVASDGTWLLVFNRAPRRRVVLHPPLDPAFQNVLIRSFDEGRSWSAPEPVPAPDVFGTECAGLTPLADGSVLLNQWQFGWIDPIDLDGEADDGETVRPEILARQWAASVEFEGLHPANDPRLVADLFPRARRGGVCRVHRAENGRAPFGPGVAIDTWPFSGGYGMRGAVVLPGGGILLPLSDVPHYRQVFTVRSDDGGRSWSPPVPVASAPDCEFEEPATLRLPDGRILMLLRENRSHVMHTVWSSDDGGTWSPPRPTGIADYPTDMSLLHDGRIAMVAGCRRPPFGIVLYLSENAGVNWSGPIIIRDNLPDRDLGYPTLAQRRDGTLFVGYYGRGTDSVTAILSTVVAGGF